MQNELRRHDILFPKLSYDIVGILIKVYKELGSDLLEKHYQKAIRLEFTQAGIIFQEQVPTAIFYKGKKIGTYFVDFLIDGVIILEIKKNNNFSKRNIDQLFGYLKVFGLQLGILANFTKNGVIYKRIVNIR
ncbi:MAG: GxxExxY protein [Patescibacteria group bacterium]